MGDEKPVHTLVGLLTERLMDVKGSFRPVDVANAFFGLQGMSACTQEVRRMIALLSLTMESIPLDMTFEGRHIGYCLSGLHNKDSKLPEVKRAVAALSLRIARSQYGAEPNVRFVQNGRRICVKMGPDVQNGVGFELQEQK